MIHYHFKYKDYGADAHGNVYGKTGRVIRGTTAGAGYVQISVNGKTLRAHRFIFECFKGVPILDNMVINHIDGNKVNNIISNLEEVTYRENTIHAFANGLVTPAMGEKNGMAIINAETVRNILRLIIAGKTNNEIEDLIGIHYKHVSLIRRKQRWKFIFEEPEFSTYEVERSGHCHKEIIKLLYVARNTKLSNIAIGNIFKVDPSNVSRFRNNHRIWVKATNFLNSESSETIESLFSEAELVEYRQAPGSSFIQK